MGRAELIRIILAGAGALLVALGLGRFGYPPIIPAMIEAGWSTAASSRFAAATNLAGYGVGAVLAAPLVRRLGVQRALAFGLIIGVVAFVASTVPLPSLAFALLRGLSGVAGGVLMILMPPLVASVVPPQSRGRANGLIFTGLGGGFLLSGTLVPALAGFSVAAAWWGLSALVIIGAAMAWVWHPRVELPGQGQAVRYAKSDARFLGLLCLYGSAAIGYVPHTTIFVDYVARELGFGLGMGGFLWVLAGLTAFISPIIGGFAAERAGFGISARMVVALMAIGAFIAVGARQPPALGLSVMLAGGLMIGLASLAAGRTREIVGGAAHASAWGFATVVYSVLQAAAAYGFSGLLQASGNDYPLMFLNAGFVLAAGVIADITLCAWHEKRAAAAATAREI